MKNSKKWCVPVALMVVLTAAPMRSESAEARAVSPGASERFTGVENRCPTFSWEAIPGAEWYELVVYELPVGFDLATGAGFDDATEVMVVRVPGGALSWTPPMESSLARGVDYAWFVRAVVGAPGIEADDRAQWSDARFFRVAASPSASEVEDAIRILSAYVDAGGVAESDIEPTVARGSSDHAGQRRAASAVNRKQGGSQVKSVGTAITAVRGEVPDPGGETYGVVGVSNSPGGAGLGAANTVGGPDLVLDGGGLTNTAISEAGIDRASGGAEVFTIANSGGGTIDLSVQGEVSAAAVSGDGSGLTGVDAATFGGLAAGNFSTNPHDHVGQAWAGAFSVFPVLSLTNLSTSGSAAHALLGISHSISGSASAVKGVIESTSPGGYSAGLRGENKGTSGNGIGVWGSHAGSGWGLHGTSVTGYAAYLTSSDSGGRGIYARGGSGTDADIVLGGTSASDDGRITSDPSYSGSDIFLTSNDAVVVELDADGDGEDADFVIEDKDSNTIFNVDESGQVSLFEPGVGEMIEMLTTELGTDGAQITLRNNAGQATIVLDAEFNAGGDGRITTEVLQITGGADLSEQFEVATPVSDLMPEPGMVVSIGGGALGMLEISRRAYDRRVAGVISGAGGVQPGMLMGQRGTAADGQYPVALTGRVYVWVDADFAPVEAGDLLTTSATLGHAQKVTDHQKAQGSVLGKAMSGLASGRGLVLTLVSLQ
jgi:hypothetical protein